MKISAERNLEIYEDIKSMVEYLDRWKTPAFDEQFKQRVNRRVPKFIASNEELRRIALVFAYSGGVQASSVTNMIKTTDYGTVFAGFDVKAVRDMNPCDIYDKHWDKIKPIKNETKLLWLVRAARVLEKGNSIVALLVKHKVPAIIENVEHIQDFWRGLKEVEKELKKLHLSGMQSVTSQLHFMLELGYDCVKPDRIVMNVAEELGIINNGRSESDLIAVTRFMQLCAVNLKLRPGVLDMYFLIQGKHTDAQLWTKQSFTPFQLQPSLPLAA